MSHPLRITPLNPIPPSPPQAAGEALVECQRINRSLAYLEQLVLNLVTGATSSSSSASSASALSHRNCKLTHLLGECVGGNSNTVMVANVRAENDNNPETVCICGCVRVRVCRCTVCVFVSVCGWVCVGVCVGETMFDGWSVYLRDLWEYDMM